MLKRIQYSQAETPRQMDHGETVNPAPNLSLLAEKLYNQLRVDFLQVLYHPLATGLYKEEFNIHKSQIDLGEFIKRIKRFMEREVLGQEVVILSRKEFESPELHGIFGSGLPYDQCIFLPLISNRNAIGVIVMANVVEKEMDLSGFSAVAEEWVNVFENCSFFEGLQMQQFPAHVTPGHSKNYPDLLSLADEYVETFGKLSREFAERLQKECTGKVAKPGKMDRTVLHLLSSRIAAARDRNELSKVVRETLEVLFAVSGFSVALIKPESGTHYCYMNEVRDSIMQHEDFTSILPREFPLNDGIFNQMLVTDGPVVFKVEELALNLNVVDYVTFWSEVGIKKVIAILLRVGENNLGGLFLYLDSDQDNNSSIELLGAVRDQIAVAISNVLAIEEIHRRNHEQSQVISFGSALASVKDRRDPGTIFPDQMTSLAQLLKEQLKKLFNIRDFAIFRTGDPLKGDVPILHDPSKSTPLPIEAAEIIVLEDPDIKGDTQFISVPDDLEGIQLKPGLHPKSGLVFSSRASIVNTYGVQLCAAGEKIGVMNFVLRKEDLPRISGNLFKGVCSQIALCVWNLITTERIAAQLTEINNYKLRLEEEKIYLKEEIQTSHHGGELIGESPEMLKTFQLIDQVSSSNATVLILGETGTGKELVARAIHENSPRKNKMLVKVNCAALPANLIESELFGHERGSFTGATERRIGKFELANNGTLFLDEIGEMPLDLQVKLLRAIQEREIERVGGSSTIKVDVRIIAATNRDLEREMELGHFRTDLYYRLNIFPIELNPLRDRKGDIPLLAAHFIHRSSKKLGREVTKISSRALQELLRYDWPGNIRELEHLIERSILLNNGDVLREIAIPVTVHNNESATLNRALLKTIDENEREHILKVLKYCSGRIAGIGGAADILGVPASTLNSKIKRLGIRKEHVL